MNGGEAEITRRLHTQSSDIVDKRPAVSAIQRTTIQEFRYARSSTVDARVAAPPGPSTQRAVNQEPAAVVAARAVAQAQQRYLEVKTMAR